MIKVVADATTFFVLWLKGFCINDKIVWIQRFLIERWLNNGRFVSEDIWEL